mgnify:CR=1 FL=1
MFTYETTVRLYDTDAAGLLFFGNHFRIIHAAYEAWLESVGLGMGEIIRDGKLLIPIIHAEADYYEPMFVGDRLTVELTADKPTTHSYSLKFLLKNKAGREVGAVKTVHVCLDNDSREKTPLPDKFRSALKALG